VTSGARPGRSDPGRGNPIGLWRRSLRARFVLLTVALSSVVVFVLGSVLLHQVGAGLLADKQHAARGVADPGFAEAQLQLRQSSAAPGPAADELLEEVISRLAGQGAYDVALLPSSGTSDGYASPPTLPAYEVPSALRARVRSGVEASTYTHLTLDGRRQNSLVVGAPLTAPFGNYELYYVFPLTSEQQTLGLVTHTLQVGGAILLFLLAAIAWLVAGQVVTPVRHASRVAERVAAGRLDERLQVHGEDDLARLAISFNRMTAALQGQIVQLEELSRVQHRFTADVSHELRTPLTTVRMAADLLYDARADFPPPAARSAELLQVQLDRFQGLLSDLLEISRYDAGVAVLEAEPTDLVSLIRQVIQGLQPHADRVGSTVDLVGLPDRLIAEVDGRRVARILRNLLENAIDYGAGSPVEVRLAADADAVAVVVSDLGPGLAEQDLDRVFMRFWRADPARARTSGGTGLGLAIAWEDAALHGGWLHAGRRQGSGATFRLVLPLRAGAELTHSPLPLVPSVSAVARDEDRRPAAGLSAP
jgi:two-component system sensor histidine kinase MtrB